MALVKRTLGAIEARRIGPPTPTGATSSVPPLAEYTAAAVPDLSSEAGIGRPRRFAATADPDRRTRCIWLVEIVADAAPGRRLRWWKLESQERILTHDSSVSRKTTRP